MSVRIDQRCWYDYVRKLTSLPAAIARVARDPTSTRPTDSLRRYIDVHSSLLSAVQLSYPVHLRVTATAANKRNKPRPATL